MQPSLGEVRYFAGNFAPRNWAFCNGQLLAISDNQALFSILGTTYGGDGRTSFALPDLRGRAPVSPGQGPGLPNVQLGERGGVAQITLTTQNLPSHNHQFTIKASSDPGNTPDPTGNYLSNAKFLDNDFIGNDPAPTLVDMASGGATSTTGASQSFDNRDPYLGVHAIICLNGIFPSRN